MRPYLGRRPKAPAGFLATPKWTSVRTFLSFQLQLFLLFLLLSHSASLFLPHHRDLGSRPQAKLALGGLTKSACWWLLLTLPRSNNVLISFNKATDVTDNPKFSVIAHLILNPIWISLQLYA